MQKRIVRPGPHARSVVAEDGQVLEVPENWDLLPPGDATLTRRVKAAGPSWTVQERRGRKTFSRGVWAPQGQIAAARTALEAERSTEAYARRRLAEANRRERKQTAYVGSFHQAVVEFLAFDPAYAKLAVQLAEAVTRHATPVGSGTVARTERIPIERRAESAVIAWMRHQTTAYDGMSIPRIKGARREVRRLLAAQSRKMLEAYRSGRPSNPATCPLQQALARLQQPAD